MTSEDALLRRLRRICLRFPETTEVTAWGHPTFKAGKKMFACLDEYHGVRCIALQPGTARRRALLSDPRFFEAPYDRQKTWVCLRSDGKLDWNEIEQWCLESYRFVALKRMLSALESPR
jgi:predicted DNA-binding protein (MmcQ/YjbR family)